MEKQNLRSYFGCKKYLKVKMVKQPYFMSRTRDSNSTDKLGVDDVFFVSLS